MILKTDIIPKRDTHPAAMPHKRLSVMILSPDPGVHGGVVTFAETLKAHLKDCDVTALWVGSHQNHRETPFQLIKRLCITPLKILQQLRRQHYDLLHINPSLNPKSLFRDGFVLLLLRLTGYSPVLVYFHGWRSSVTRIIRRTPGLRQGFAWLLNGTDRILVLSPDFKTELESLGVRSDKILFTRTMFDGAALKNALVPATPERRSILFMSRFERTKGVYELIDAFGRIASAFPDVDLIMAGDGPENKALQARVQLRKLNGRVFFPGYVGGEEKSRLLQNATIYALPTYFPEGMPIALLEAMGAGKALLTAKAGSIRHIVSDPENGVILDTVTADSVEAGLRKMLGDRDYCAQTSERNRAYAWERFEAGVVTAEIEALYRELARPHV